MLSTGFAMFDRFAVPNLSNFIMEDIEMTSAQLGQTMAVFALAWAFSGYIGSIFSDLTSNKKRLLGFMVLLSSVFSFSTGLATSFTMLLIVRFIMGLFEGPIFPLTQTFSIAQSTVNRRGLNTGLITTTSMGVIANLIGPVLLVALCQAFGWRITFFFTIISGLMIAWLIFKNLKEPDMTKIPGATAKDEKPTFRESLVVLKNRNVRISMIISIFVIIWNVGILTYAPYYLVAFKGFTDEVMSYIMAVFGAGAVVWGIIVPAFSDRYGRKPAVIVFTLISVISPLGLMLFEAPFIIGVCAFLGWTGSGVFALFQATITGESVDTKYASTAIASVQVTGEIGGAVIGVMIAGILADMYGLNAAFIFAAVCVVIATLTAFAYYETAPAILAKRNLSKT